MTEREQALRTDFLALPENAQKLYVRLLTRRGPAIRRDKVAYAEIEDMEQASDTLLSTNFLQINPDARDEEALGTQVEVLLPLLTKAELLQCIQQLCPSAFPMAKSQKKIEIQSLLLTNLAAEALLTWIYEHFQFYIPLRAEDFELYQLAFFGNQHQSLTEFVVEELGHIRYENYSLCEETRYFRERDELEQMYLYSQISQALEIDYRNMPTETLLQLFQELPRPSTDHHSLRRRFDKICNLLGRQLERLEAYDLALEVYTAIETPPARERMCRIWVKQEQFDLAINQCELMQSKPYNEEEREFAQFFLSKLKPEQWQPLRKEQEKILKLIPRDTLTLPKLDQPVELSVAQALIAKDEDLCWYCENTLWNALFGLTYWQVIFAPVTGAFHHPFQSGPADLHTPSFLTKRENYYQPIQDLFENPNALHQHILNNFDNKQNIANRFVAWKVLDREMLTTAFERLPVEVLKLVFARLWTDIKSNRSGFSDLIYFPADGGFELIEVKGPGDKLQKNQIRWLTYFKENNIPARVIDVVWQDD